MAHGAWDMGADMEMMKMNICECKHWHYCKIEDKSKCKLQGDPWVMPDNKIFGLDSIEINKMQGRDGDLKRK